MGQTVRNTPATRAIAIGTRSCGKSLKPSRYMSFYASQLIERSEDAVWRTMTDWSKAPYWLGVENLRPLEPAEPVGQGSRLIFSVRGTAHSINILRWKPRRGLTLESKQGGLIATYVYTIQRTPQGTQVELSASCRGDGWFWRLLIPVVGRLMERSERSQLVALKRLVEATT